MGSKWISVIYIVVIAEVDLQMAGYPMYPPPPMYHPGPMPMYPAPPPMYPMSMSMPMPMPMPMPPPPQPMQMVPLQMRPMEIIIRDPSANHKTHKPHKTTTTTTTTEKISIHHPSNGQSSSDHDDCLNGGTRGIAFSLQVPMPMSIPMPHPMPPPPPFGIPMPGPMPGPMMMQPGPGPIMVQMPPKPQMDKTRRIPRQPRSQRKNFRGGDDTSQDSDSKSSDSHERKKKLKRKRKKHFRRQFRSYLENSDELVKPILTYLAKNGDIKLRRRLSNDEADELTNDLPYQKVNVLTGDDERNMPRILVTSDKHKGWDKGEGRDGRRRQVSLPEGKAQHMLGEGKKELVFRPPTGTKISNLSVSFQISEK